MDLTGVTGKFLAEADGGGVLQVGAADFEDVVKFLRLGVEGGLQFGQGGNQLALDAFQGGDMDGGGDDVVAGLAAVDVVVRMHQLFAAFAAEEFDGAVGNDFVGVHVGRGARPGLENIEDEFGVPFAVGDFFSGLGDDLGQFGLRPPSSTLVRAACFLISPRARIMERGKRRPLMGKFSTARAVCAP